MASDSSFLCLSLLFTCGFLFGVTNPGVEFGAVRKGAQGVPDVFGIPFLWSAPGPELAV